MSRPIPVAVLLLLISTTAHAQHAAPVADQTAALRAVVQAQQHQLDAQRQQLEDLRSLVLQQGRAIEALREAHAGMSAGTASPATGAETGATPPSGTAHGPTSTAPVTVAQATPRAAPGAAPGADASTLAGLVTPAAPPAVAPEVRAQAAAQGPPATPTQEVQPTRGVAQEAPTGLAAQFGPVRLRLGGYFAVTGIYRSTNSGGGVGTNFAATPYEDAVDGNVSEARLSAQSTRLSLRIDTPSTRSDSKKLAGYVEMDFNGATPGTVAVTSSGVGVRLRHAFGEATFNDSVSLEVGQAFTLMTPQKGRLSAWPSDQQLTRAVDSNYVAGLVWARQPQVRLTWRPSQSVSWAFSAENPEQQVSSRVTWPACCGDALRTQYNTGSQELKVPNLMPDLVTRVAYDPGRRFHADVGGVVRVFRHTLAPYDRDFRQVGGGVSANVGIVGGATRVLLQGAWGSGLGRYIGGLVPDVIVRADGSISPIRSGSWVAGVEHDATSRVSLAGYFSGVYADSNVATDVGGTFIGYGYPGAPNSHNRLIRQVTGIAVWQMIRTADRGSLQLNTQASWLTRSPWSRGAGPASADALVFLSQVQYNLP